MPASTESSTLLQMTRDIVIAQVSHNAVRAEALATLILDVHRSLQLIAGVDGAATFATTAAVPSTGVEEVDAAAGDRAQPVSQARSMSAAAGAETARTAAPAEASRGARRSAVARTAREEGREPAVPRERSVAADHIVCLFDGVRRKMLKRHIKTRYGMTPDAYREYWELGEDYPMVAPSYSTEKRDYAMLTGFGLPRAESRRRSA